MLVRTATAADIPAMLALERHAATAAHWTAEQYQQAFASTGPRRILLVIEAGPTLQGFLVAKAVDTEWEIENLAVAGPARRRGMGTRLLGEFLSQARTQQAKSVFLEVRESNQAARSLYERWAFVESGRRKRYYRNPDEDAVVYSLSFP